MKITIEHYEKTYSIDLGTDEVIFDDFIQSLEDMSGVVFSSGMWNNWFGIKDD